MPAACIIRRSHVWSACVALQQAAGGLRQAAHGKPFGLHPRALPPSSPPVHPVLAAPPATSTAAPCAPRPGGRRQRRGASCVRRAWGRKASREQRQEVERSLLVLEELMAFMFQLDLDTQLQRALNYEAFELAKEIRDKRSEVDEAIKAMQQRKSRNAGQPAAASELTPADFAAEGLRLRTEMQRAVEAEQCVLRCAVLCCPLPLGCCCYPQQQLPPWCPACLPPCPLGDSDTQSCLQAACAAACLLPLTQWAAMY